MKRSGASLVEILMGVLIMAVGATAVFSLFPVSVVMSIKAHQLTSAKLLCENTSEAVRFDDRLLRPPTTPYADRGDWSPGTVYAVGDAVRPTHSGIPPQYPFAVYVCTRIESTNRSRTSEPVWPTGTATTSVFDGTLDSLTGDLVDGVQWTLAPPVHFIIDPVGFAIETAPALQVVYGNRIATDPGFISPLRRATAPVRDYFVDPDGWTVLHEEVPVSFTASEVTFGPGFDNASLPPGSMLRIPLYNEASFSTAVSTAANPHAVSTVTPIPATQVDNARMARLEIHEPRVTCMLAVHCNGIDAPTVQIPVLFNRAPGFNEEFVYDANFGNSLYTGSTRVQLGTLTEDQVVVAWTSSGTGKEPDPFLKAGGYVLDARNARFYEIADVGAQQVVGAETTVVLTLSRPVQEKTTGAAANIGQAIFLPGIIKVYDFAP